MSSNKEKAIEGMRKGKRESRRRKGSKHIGNSIKGEGRKQNRRV